MSQTKYYPSPFRKDYTKRPLIQKCYKIGKRQDIVLLKSVNRENEQNRQIQENIKYYKDGMLWQDSDIKSGIFFMNWPGTQQYHFSDISVLLFSLAKKDQKISKIVNKDKIYRKKGIRNQDLVPHGKNYIISANGSIIQANYFYGLLDKWLIGYSHNQFILCYHYSKGIKEGMQYYYDNQQSILAVSSYHNGQLLKIENIYTDKFQQLITDQDLLKSIQTLRYKNIDHINNKIPNMKINSQIQYFGSIKKHKLQKYPDGYGVMLNKTKQLFIGNFNCGYLSQIGFMKLQQGNSYYFGQFNNGACQGYGCYCINQNVIYKFGNQDITRQQFAQFMNQSYKRQIDKQWMTNFDEIQQFRKIIAQKLDIKLYYEQPSLRKLSITKQKAESIDKKSSQFGINLEQVELSKYEGYDRSGRQEKQKNRVKKVYYAKDEAEENEKTKTYLKKQKYRQRGQTITVSNSRQDIRVQKLDNGGSFVNKQSNYLRVNNFESKSGFHKDTQPNKKIYAKHRRAQIDLGNLYHQDSNSNSDSDFFNKL